VRSSSFASGFDETAFRSAVEDTMLMGMPETVADRLTFWWQRDKVYSPDDAAGSPYDWTAAPVSDDPGNPALPDDGVAQSLVVTYAIEFAARTTGSATVFGEIDTSRAVVTVMDSDYEQIKTADYATIGDTRYRIQFRGPPIGLFGVSVWSVYLEAEDAV
jgi:hypothetical protein